MARRVRGHTIGPRQYARRAAPRPDSGLVLDQDLLASLRQPGDRRDGNHLPVTGACHDCGRQVSGERRFCGPCLAGHE